jgi:hypothetical protein
MKMTFALVATAILAIGASIAQGEPDVTASDTAAKQEQPIAITKNIRLDFKMIPLEEDDNGVFILTAGPEYRTSTRWDGEGTEIRFEVSGKITIREDGKLVVQYAAHLRFHTAEGKAEFRTASTVLLEAGKELAVAQMGEKTLMICATPINPQ